MSRRHEISATALTSGPMSDGLFSGLPAQAVRQLSAMHSAHGFPSNTVLFQEGEPADGIFLLCGGTVKLYVGSSRGDTLLLRSAGAGEILGLSATLTGQGHEVTAETTTPSRLVFIPRKEFLRYLQDHSEICMQVVQSLSNDVHAAYDRVRMLGLARIRHSHN